MSFDYCDDDEHGLPVSQSYALRDCLSLVGLNKMRVALEAIPGSYIKPGYSFQLDERTGWYWIDEGKWGWSAFGFPSFTLENGILTYIDLSGRSLTLSLPTLTANRTQTYQNKSGTIALTEKLSAKNYARAATTENITLSGSQTIDGVTLINGDRVVVKDQTDLSENGIYLYNSSGAWTRATDFDETDELTGAFVTVVSGDDNLGKLFIQVTENPVINTDDIVWVAVSGSGGGSVYYTAEYANNSVTPIEDNNGDVFDITGKNGRIRFEDDENCNCCIRLNPNVTNGLLIETGTKEWVRSTTPSSTQIGVVVEDTEVVLYVGSAAGRRIGWKYDGILPE